MKVAYFDCTSGISGDMCLGALISAGASPRKLRTALKGLGVGGYRLTVRQVTRAGLVATKVDVIESKNTAGKGPKRLADFRKILRASGLPAGIKKKAGEVFNAIFQAEARVHGSTPAKVHLHEMGSVDTLVDVVGTVVCLDMLGIRKVFASPVNTGHGTVKTAHGVLPVPAPATVELLRGVPVYCTGPPFELTTPTGAAIIGSTASAFGAMPLIRLAAIGTGAGGHDPGAWPNVLRVFVGSEEAGQDDVTVLETNIDDMDSRLYPHVMERLMEAGALDVWLTAILMKKGRPANKLSVMCTAELAPALTDIVLGETTSLGLRSHTATRSVLERSVRKVRTRFGLIRVKEAIQSGRALRAVPEYEDCRRAAKRNAVAVADVIKAAEYAAAAPRR